MGKIYEYRTTVTIGDTNLLQHMYFVQFFTLQGITRDLWVKECVQGGLDSHQEWACAHHEKRPVRVQEGFLSLRQSAGAHADPEHAGRQHGDCLQILQ